MSIKTNILVVGDIILDEYIIGKSSRLSPEAPIPVVDVNTIKYKLGGAANVAHNLKSIGAEVVLCGLVGNDSDSSKILSLLREEEIDTSGVVTDLDRVSTIKTRVVSSNRQIVRYDIEDRTEYEGNNLINFIGDLEEKDIDAVVISDYGKGVITGKLMSYLGNKFITRPIIVDPNINNYIYYINNTDIITPNIKEAKALYESTDLRLVAERLMQLINCGYVLITEGQNGMTLYDSSSINKPFVTPLHIDTEAKSVYDVSGAGDTVVAVLAAALGAGMSPYEAAKLANKAAGIVVGDLGTSVVGDRLWKN